jgi:hypothetical protein
MLRESSSRRGADLPRSCVFTPSLYPPPQIRLEFICGAGLEIESGRAAYRAACVGIARLRPCPPAGRGERKWMRSYWWPSSSSPSPSPMQTASTSCEAAFIRCHIVLTLARSYRRRFSFARISVERTEPGKAPVVAEPIKTRGARGHIADLEKPGPARSRVVSHPPRCRKRRRPPRCLSRTAAAT